MATVAVTISTSFRVQTPKAFLAEPAIARLESDLGECCCDDFSLALDVREESTGASLICLYGYGEIPPGVRERQDWMQAIQRHLKHGERVRISTAGFADDLAHTVAWGVDILEKSITPQDAGCASGAGPLEASGTAADFEPMVTVSSSFRIRDPERFVAEPCIQALRNAFTPGLDENAPSFARFAINTLPDGCAEIAFAGTRGIPDLEELGGTDWKLILQRHLIPGEVARVSMAGFDEAFKYTVGCCYDIRSERINVIDVSYGALLGRQWFHTLREADPGT
jgi:hypothetical protein